MKKFERSYADLRDVNFSLRFSAKHLQTISISKSPNALKFLL